MASSTASTRPRARPRMPALPTVGRVLLVLGLIACGCRDADDANEAVACAHDSECDGQVCVMGVCRDGGATTGSGHDSAVETSTSDTTATGDTAGTTVGADPCGNVCLDDDTLGVCNVVDQSIMPVSCTQACAAMGFSSAIGCNVATSGSHQCYCDEASAGCTESACGGGNALAECLGGMLTVRECEQECEESQGSAGECAYNQVEGFYFCNCIAGSCVEGTTFCQDELTEMVCLGGSWQAQPCSDAVCHEEVCEVEFASCPPDYQARTLGCGYNSFYGDMGCRCTS